MPSGERTPSDLDWDQPAGTNLAEMVDSAGYIVRAICMLILTLLLVLGAYYGLKVLPESEPLRWIRLPSKNRCYRSMI